jgi:hypothetical protein
VGVRRRRARGRGVRRKERGRVIVRMIERGA